MNKSIKGGSAHFLNIPVVQFTVQRIVLSEIMKDYKSFSRRCFGGCVSLYSGERQAEKFYSTNNSVITVIRGILLQRDVGFCVVLLLLVVERGMSEIIQGCTDSYLLLHIQFIS